MRGSVENNNILILDNNRCIRYFPDVREVDMQSGETIRVDNRLFVGPVALGRAHVPQNAGVFAILWREWPMIHPGAWLVADVASSDNLAKDLSWDNPRSRDWINVVGESRQVFVAYQHIPERTAREKLVSELVDRFRPPCSASRKRVTRDSAA
jgi:hypothetical protein